MYVALVFLMQACDRNSKVRRSRKGIIYHTLICYLPCRGYFIDEHHYIVVEVIENYKFHHWVIAVLFSRWKNKLMMCGVDMLLSRGSLSVLLPFSRLLGIPFSPSSEFPSYWILFDTYPVSLPCLKSQWSCLTTDYIFFEDFEEHDGAWLFLHTFLWLRIYFMCQLLCFSFFFNLCW